VTDAQLVLGRLPEELAGGRIRLRRDLAEEAIGRLADRLGMETVEAAASIIRIANTVMSRALRLVTIERGYDPRFFALYAYGGAGPLHAVELADELGAKEVVIPPLPGVFSALGLLVTDYRHDFHMAVMRRTDELAEEELEKVFAEMAEKALAMLRGEGVPEDRVQLVRRLDMRYQGQAYELSIPYRGSLKEAVEEFHQMHRERYGFSLLDAPVLVVNARLAAYGITAKPRLPRAEPKPYRPEPASRRRVYFDEAGWTETPIYKRSELRPGAEIEGPAVIESDDSTVLVPPGHFAQVDKFYTIRIERF